MCLCCYTLKYHSFKKELAASSGCHARLLVCIAGACCTLGGKCIPLMLFQLVGSQIEALQEVLEKLKSKRLPSAEKKLGWVPSVRTLSSFP